MQCWVDRRLVTPTGWLSSHRAIFGAKNLNTSITVAIEYLDYGHSAITQGKPEHR